ncbi:hypothetical protein E2C01_016173 [Portunus trituberculatus]|uniref:Uncharacterized protein n=1 Tax=Portunus trituberculatus TaxID=210409 RepID=A0A5B7DQ25_PORTR|nr:hypothetical protein [Portunus trituberculatus]
MAASVHSQGSIHHPHHAERSSYERALLKQGEPVLGDKIHLRSQTEAQSPWLSPSIASIRQHDNLALIRRCCAQLTLSRAPYLILQPPHPPTFTTLS